MKDEIFELINSHLNKWNPINIPNTPDDEYEDLVPLIVNYFKGEKDSLKIIDEYFCDILGGELEDKIFLEKVVFHLNAIKEEIIHHGLKF
jgi:hypothetical protein